MTTPRRPLRTASKAPRAASSRAGSSRKNPPRTDSPRRHPRTSDDFAALLMQYFDARFPNALPDSPKSRAPNSRAPQPPAPRKPAPKPSIKRSTRATKNSSPPIPIYPLPTYPVPTQPEPAPQVSAPFVSTTPPALASTVAAPVAQLARAITAELGRAYYAYVALADRLLDDVAKQNPAQVNPTHENTAQEYPAQQYPARQTATKRHPTKRQASPRNSSHRRLAPGPTSLLLALGDAEARTAAEPSLAPDPHPGLTVGTLAERTRLASSTVAGLLARLERERLIERTRPANDQRLVYVQLTNEARRLVPQLRTTDELLAELTTAALQPTAAQPTAPHPAAAPPATQSTRPKTSPARTVAALTQTLDRLSALTATFQEAATQLAPARPEPESKKLSGPIADLIEPTEAEVQRLLAQFRAEETQPNRPLARTPTC